MSGKDIHILVVENEEAHAELIRRAFELRGGDVRLTLACDLGEARHCLREFVPDLVIADLLLPDGKGTELLSGEKEEPSYPVVVMTGHGDERIAVEAMKAGALDYVVKSEAMLADMPHLTERTLREWHHITERKRATEAMRKQREELQIILDSVPAGIWYKDTENRLVRVNKAGAMSINMKPEDIEGREVSEIFPQDAEHYYRDDLEVIRTGKPKWGIIEEMQVPGGEKKWVHTDKVPYLDEQGNVSGIIAFVVDITERKKAEEKLLEYQSQLKSLASELLLTEERERRRLAAGLHDNVGQNLALTKLAVQSLMESVSDPNMVASLDEICTSIDKTIQDAHSLTFELSNPVLYELGFEAAVEQWLGEQIQEKCGIEYKFSVDSPRLPLDNEISVALFQAVRELLINIAKHAKAKTVEVHIQENRDKVEVTVEDDGVGFVSSKQNLHLAQNSIGGFGLFSIRERLEYLGGAMTIKSSPGQGTCVILTVPLKR